MKQLFSDGAMDNTGFPSSKMETNKVNVINAPLYFLETNFKL